MDFTLLNRITILCARRNSGKSELLRSLVEDHKDEFYRIFVICPTEKVNGFYEKAGIVAPENIRDSWSEEWATKLIDNMTKLSKTSKKHVLLIMDDLVGDLNFRKSKTINTLFARSRHINISLIIAVQYLHTINPLQRNNADWVLVGQMNSHSIEILCEEYIAKMSKKEFIELYNRATKNYSFLLINNNSVKTDSLDELYQIVRCELKK